MQHIHEPVWGSNRCNSDALDGPAPRLCVWNIETSDFGRVDDVERGSSVALAVVDAVDGHRSMPVYLREHL